MHLNHRPEMYSPCNSDVREQVFRLISDPFIISGTLRTNVDPYNDYRDRDILRMMDLINIKKYMPKECQH